MSDRYESIPEPERLRRAEIIEKLAAIEEELRDLAYERLREIARSPDSDDSVAAAAEEKRLLQARRAIAKAISALSPALRAGDE